MRKVSRRRAIRSVAASQLAGTAVGSLQGHTLRTGGAQAMTLQEFQTLNGVGSVAQLFSHLKCGTFTKCHEEMRREHGVWIPELVPVFKKLDAMAAHRTPV